MKLLIKPHVRIKFMFQKHWVMLALMVVIYGYQPHSMVKS